MPENRFENRILVHTCCAPCATYVFEKLSDDGYSPHSFFYNPNIHPDQEYQKRLNELVNYLEIKHIPLFIKEKDEQSWFEKVKGFENELEGGLRCEVCFRIRLEETAKFALSNNYKIFTTVLTVSPHKNAKVINKVGSELAQKYNLTFLEENFKKQDGFKKSLLLSSKYNLFRQNYCGCIYSIR